MYHDPHATTPPLPHPPAPPRAELKSKALLPQAHQPLSSGLTGSGVGAARSSQLSGGVFLEMECFGRRTRCVGAAGLLVEGTAPASSSCSAASPSPWLTLTDAPGSADTGSTRPCARLSRPGFWLQRRLALGVPSAAAGGGLAAVAAAPSCDGEFGAGLSLLTRLKIAVKSAVESPVSAAAAAAVAADPSLLAMLSSKTPFKAESAVSRRWCRLLAFLLEAAAESPSPPTAISPPLPSSATSPVDGEARASNTLSTSKLLAVFLEGVGGVGSTGGR